MSREGIALYYQAIKALPEEWVENETYVTLFTETQVIAANFKYPPMEYIALMDEWHPIEFNLPDEYPLD